MAAVRNKQRSVIEHSPHQCDSGIEDGQTKDDYRSHPPSRDLLGKQYHQRSYRKTQQHTAGIAHKYLCWVAVERQEATNTSYKAKTNYNPHGVTNFTESPGRQVYRQEQQSNRNNRRYPRTKSIKPCRSKEFVAPSTKNITIKISSNFSRV